MKYQLLLASLVINGIPVGATAAEKVDFTQQIKPILESTCLSCHGAEKPKGSFRLDTKAGALKGGDKGPALVPGNPKQSPAYTATILPPGHEDIMPPKGDPLTKPQTELIRQWIEQGADWPDGVVLKTVKRVDFARDIRPILELNCVACHREGHAKGELRLDNKADAFKGGDKGPGIVPGGANKSTLYVSVTLPSDHDDLMPPKNKGGPLPKDQIDLLRDWIDQGALWPDGVTLVPRKADEAGPGNEVAIVAELHKKILATSKETAAADMKRFTETIPGTPVTFDMLPIPGGQFAMGSSNTEPGRNPDESPRHNVVISPFWMGKCEVTWNEYELFMYPEQQKKSAPDDPNNPYVDGVADAVSRPTKPYVEMSFGMGKDGYPAISMTQHAANKYCEWLSAKTGHYYRLPTEAEWEYACRAGATTAYFFGDDPEELGDYAWYEKNSDFKYQKVGKKKPNPWGLYDMHGNVAEWCLDQYEPNYDKFAGTLSQDPWLRATKPYPHVARGGSWDDDPTKLRSAARRGSTRAWKQQDPQLPKSFWYLTDAQFLGFRVVRPLKVPPPEELSNYWTSGVEKD